MSELPIDITQRVRLFTIVEELIEECKCQDGQFALLLVSVSKFRQINITNGFQVGDELLIEINHRLSKVTREHDMVLRVGNSEFLVIARNILNEGHATLAAVKILSELEESYEVSNRRLKINLHVGIAVYPDQGQNSMTLLKNTESALCESRRSVDSYFIFTEQDDLTDMTSWDIGSELLDAIEQDQFELYLQPQIELENGRVYGVEALLRWKHPQRGFVRPDYFIPIAEHSNLIHNITYWTIHAALWLVSDQPREFEGLKISINLSPMILQSEGLIESINDITKIFNVDLKHLTLEVTESAFIEDMSVAIKALNQLKDIGINISIDDFGTGYSSMSYFKSIPANELKIDQSFVTNMMENPMDLHIVRSIIDMAHGFGLKVVAEGIENRECFDFLKSLDCDIGQGYYISKPMSQEAFVEWLRQYNQAIGGG
jgi:diguanylate cyclase (GGDEF)-like protein